MKFCRTSTRLISTSHYRNRVLYIIWERKQTFPLSPLKTTLPVTCHIIPGLCLNRNTKKQIASPWLVIASSHITIYIIPQYLTDWLSLEYSIHIPNAIISKCQQKLNWVPCSLRVDLKLEVNMILNFKHKTKGLSWVTSHRNHTRQSKYSLGTDFFLISFFFASNLSRCFALLVSLVNYNHSFSGVILLHHSQLKLSAQFSIKCI